MMGVTYQQAYKYETSISHISAGRLYQIAQALGIDVGYFYDGMDSERSLEPTPQQRLLLQLTRSFTAIPDERHRAALCDLARVLVAAELSGGEADQHAGAIVLAECHRKMAI